MLKRHRKISLLLKLMIIASLIMMVISIYFILNSNKANIAINAFKNIHGESEKIILADVSYQGIDANRQKYIIFAKKASAKNRERIILENITANFKNKIGDDFKIEAKKAEFEVGKFLEIEDISIFTQNGYVIKAPKAYIFLEKNIIKSDNEIKIEGENHTIFANNFEILNNENLIYLGGKVHVTIHAQ